MPYRNNRAMLAADDPTLIGWKPRAWQKSSRRMWNGNGRRKPRGSSYTASPAAQRRKARNKAARRHA